MRVALLIVAGLALAGFLVVAVVLPQMAGSEARAAAEALISGAEAARQQVAEAAEKAGSLAGSGKGVKLQPRMDPDHGELKWLVADNGAVRGWNDRNAIEVTFTPVLQGGKVSWTCRGYPVSAMPPTCGGR
ncbi:MAG TPA: hypothetical protein VK043_10945 [Burkholderiales bacterium]|nr:hypothetical protein [Burkholderiales bacterium]